MSIARVFLAVSLVTAVQNAGFSRGKTDFPGVSGLRCDASDFHRNFRSFELKFQLPLRAYSLCLLREEAALELPA